MENRHSHMYLILWLTPVTMVISLFLVKTLLPDWTWENELIHASFEAITGLASLLLALFLFQRDSDEYSGELVLISTGLICMGVLNTVHGMIHPGHSFTFLHLSASIVGSFFWALIWLPRSVTQETFAHASWLPIVFGILATLFGIGTVSQHDMVPMMVLDHTYTPVANVMIITSSVFFLVAVPRLMSNLKHSGKGEFFMLFCLALLFGLSELNFLFSVLWDAGWWLWHLIIRLIACLIGLWFLGTRYVTIFLEQKRIQEELYTNQANLEQLVEERTSVIEERTAALKQSQEVLQLAVRDYSDFAEQVAQGNLTVRLSSTNGHDELGILSDNLNRMVESLREMTTQTREAATNIASAAAEILAASSQQASSASEQSAAITQATTTVDEIKTIAQQTAQQANQVANQSQSMLQVAQQGTQTVEATISSMEQIRTRVESIAQTILALSEQSQTISAITTTVSEIADQSNMLALNAAIEAARAGEQGRSFAVVAQNVRELAERSKAATAQVQEILSEIQRSTNAAVMVTEEGSKGVEQGVQQASQAGQSIHRIATEVEHGAQANTQMAAAAHQQTAGVEQIGQAMQSIQQATKQALASTRQAETAARDLHALAQSLQKVIAAYRL